MAAKKKPKCRVTAYAQAVVAGSIVAGLHVRRACQRHLDDLLHGAARGLRFDSAAAARAIDFCELQKHSKGKWAKTPLILSAWQSFLVGCLFGWLKADGLRRFRVAFCELARKNGKSTLAAAIGLLLAFFDGEAGAEVYTAATKRDQARIVHGEAVRMVRASAHLQRYIKIFKDNLSSEQTNSKYEPLGADADTLDGLNPNGVIIDELHAHKTRAMLDVLDTATGARQQPLLFIITTAGYDRTSVCWDMHAYACRVLDGTAPNDDGVFAFIASIDEGDDWQDEVCWVKANPNLGVSVQIEDLRAKSQKAKQMPAALNGFLRLHLNVWTQQVSAWLTADLWAACAGPIGHAELPETLAGRDCFGGLDLASSTDIAAWLKLFPDGDGGFDCVPTFWVPEQACRERERLGRQRLDLWIEQGLIMQTAGEVIDFDVIRATICADGDLYVIREIAADPWNALQILTQLATAGFEVFRFRQSTANMAGPCKELEGLLRSGRLRHGGHPVLSWMAGNVSVKKDAGDNMRPDKPSSQDKIDGIVALLMALGRAMVTSGAAPSITAL